VEEILLHDAAMEVDVIIGYPWLRQKKIGLLPHMDGLIAEKNGDLLFYRCGKREQITSTPEKGGGDRAPKGTRSKSWWKN
jgi:hypothetical protein